MARCNSGTGVSPVRENFFINPLFTAQARRLCHHGFLQPCLSAKLLRIINNPNNRFYRNKFPRTSCTSNTPDSVRGIKDSQFPTSYQTGQLREDIPAVRDRYNRNNRHSLLTFFFITIYLILFNLLIIHPVRCRFRGDGTGQPGCAVTFISRN